MRKGGRSRDELDELEDARDAEYAEDLDDADDARIARYTDARARLGLAGNAILQQGVTWGGGRGRGRGARLVGDWRVSL